MRSRCRRLPFFTAVLMAVPAAGIGLRPRANATPIASLPASRAIDQRAEARAVYAGLSLAFEAVPVSKGGRARHGDQFRAAGSGYGLLLTPTEATLALPASRRAATRRGDAARRDERQRWERPTPALPAVGPPPAAAIHLQWCGADARSRASGLEKLPGKVNRYVGRDPNQWECGSSLYAKVRYTGVYPGIDLTYYGNQRRLEYDWTVAPGADPQRIRLAVHGARSVRLNARGELEIGTAGGALCQPRPWVYQERAGRRVTIAGGYVLLGRGQVGFQVGPYDRTRPLVIDPTLVYSTFLGGPGADEGLGIALDAAGNVYLTGIASALTIWPTSPGMPSRSSSQTGPSAFVTRLDLTKSGAAALVYSTYLGSNDTSTGIAVDGAGNAYVAGDAGGDTLPVTLGTFQPAFKKGQEEAFAAKLSPTGTLLYATYLGDGFTGLGGTKIAVDPAGNAYLTGSTNSPDFPTLNAFQQKPHSFFEHAWVMNLDPAGKPLYSTYLGGIVSEDSFGIAADGAGNAYVTGVTNSPDFPTTSNAAQRSFASIFNAFVTKFSPTGGLLYSTFLGAFSFGHAIAVDSAQNMYVTGFTRSSAFPVTPGCFQPTNRSANGTGFVARIGANGRLVYATYLGGSGSDQGLAIAVDAAGNAFVTGITSSPDFPVTPSNGVQTKIGLGPGGKPTSDAFVTILEPGGKSLLWSSYLGGNGDDAANGIAVDGGSDIYLVGSTDSPNFPAITGAFQSSFGGDQGADRNRVIPQGDAFVAKVSLK